MEKPKIITVKDIARRLKLPVVTVNYALNDLPGFQKSLKQQILNTANELGYVHKTLVVVKHAKVVTAAGFKPEARKRDITMADIADLLHISIATVSRALSGSKLVGKATVEKVLKAAAELGFVVNTDAQNLRANSLQRAGDDRKRITIHEVAYFANVSASTVSRCYAPNSDVSDKTRERVLKAAHAMGFTLQEHARRLRTNNGQIAC